MEWNSQREDSLGLVAAYEQKRSIGPSPIFPYVQFALEYNGMGKEAKKRLDFSDLSAMIFEILPWNLKRN